ncbi:DUF4013 domain-containing protein [Methanobrevibacter olleyae]|uniref:Membrane domain of glycerophosphoryl diester phosphodiesterase n=1 Tax=Methanobrevibacter olleyae TaxID=294671 RepID=A0A126QXN0_METOL|nr:DUF4013 domain-containing protein [Methanobrevibacter olleyae]AMK14564.1 hypothetical protein YLM1_0004 [Methanobrevibacter olleyae]SFL28051.1 Protein of unknown function [Methanobrevibacter olleyae]
MSSITDVVKEGLKYPFNDGKKVLVLGLIFLISSFISFFIQYLAYDSMKVIAENAPIDTAQKAFSMIPQTNMALIVLSFIVIFILMIFCSGYLYNVIKYSIEARFELPEFKDIKGIFLNGIRSLIVGIAYTILPAILFLLGLMLTVNESIDCSINYIGGIILIISIILAIFISLVEIMAMSNMIYNDELAAAFRFREILALIKNIGWIKFIGILLFSFITIMIISAFFNFLFGAIAFGISILTGSALVLALINLILNALLIESYTSIVISRIYGSIYKEATNIGGNDGELEKLE